MAQTGSKIADDLKQSFTDAITLKGARDKASNWLSEKSAAVKDTYNKAYSKYVGSGSVSAASKPETRKASTSKTATASRKPITKKKNSKKASAKR